MADIQTEIDDFENAVYGDEVRDSMVSLAVKLNTEVETSTANVNQYTASVTQAITNANTAADRADTASNSATIAANNANTAATQANTARNNANAATTSATNAAETANAIATATSDAKDAIERNEAARQAAEQDRADYETVRRDAEDERRTNETTRQANEATRQTNEDARRTNETTRQANEAERERAEGNRRKSFSDLVQQVLPVASDTTLGGIIVGSGLTVDSDGLTSVVGAGDLETGTHAAATYATKTELAGKANTAHVHNASDITGGTVAASVIPPLDASKIGSGTIPIARGGTGATSAEDARTALDAAQSNGATGTLKDAEDAIALKANATHAHDASDVTTGTLTIGRGGTGQGAPTSETTAGDVATAGAGCTVTGANFWQWGKVGQLYIGITVNETKGWGNVLATLAEDKCPVMVTPLTNTASLTQACTAHPNGDIQAKSSITAGSTIYLIGTYIIQ